MGANETPFNYSSQTPNLMNGIVGLWHLDEPVGTAGAGTVVDKSGYANNGTPGGTYQFGTAGKLSTAFYSSSAGFIDLGNASSLNLSGALTISAWIFGTSTGGWTSIISKGDSSYRLSLFNTTSKLDFGTTGLSNQDLASNGTVIDGRWHHVVAVYGGTTNPNKYIYIDGILDTSVIATGTLATNSYDLAISTNLEAGARYWNGSDR